MRLMALCRAMSYFSAGKQIHLVDIH